VKERRVVVTGGAARIGAATVALLRRTGARVTVVDLPGRSGDADGFVACDLADPASINAALQELGDGWDGLCNVAGVPGTQPPDRVIAVNFLGLRHLTDMMVERMAPGGAIVNVASTAGSLWQQNYELARGLVDTVSYEDGLAWVRSRAAEYPPYNLSKEAVIIYTMAMAARAWRSGLRINAVSPGPVETAILPDFEDSMGKSMLDWVRDCVGRHADPGDIAPVITFLTDPASAWLNGANLVADGGFTAAMMTGTATT
jgi:NAD(P)-dependent dehydrogenase (short-subunit alcohol dehydrogenase family)